jgi:hypothetical protein
LPVFFGAVLCVKFWGKGLGLGGFMGWISWKGRKGSFYAAKQDSFNWL